MRGRKPICDWCSVLIDAGVRGLSPQQVADERGAAVTTVWCQARAYGVRLAFKPSRRPQPTHDKNQAKAGRTRSLSARQKWDRRFCVEVSGEITLNDFCKKNRISGQWSVKREAERRGFSFKPPSNEHSRATMRGKRKRAA